MAKLGLRLVTGRSNANDVPLRLEAVSEALAEGREVVPVCQVVGGDLAREGYDLTTGLEWLRQTWQARRGEDPSYAAVAAFASAWGDHVLGLVGNVACHNPLSGLATVVHLRTRISELHRVGTAQGTSVTDSHALVVVDISGEGEDLRADLTLARVAEVVWPAFSTAESIAQASRRRMIALVPRDPGLGARLNAARTLADAEVGQDLAPRIWLERIPRTDEAVGFLLDEMARG